MSSNIKKSYVHQSYDMKFSKKRLVTRRKVLIVPYYVTIDTKIKLVLVKDVKTNEWGFISGGVKMKESYINAAKREFFEETSNSLSFPLTYKTFTFISLYRPSEFKKYDYKRNEIVRSIYTVYTFEIHNIDIDLMNTFVPNKEVKDIKCDFYERFTNTWCFSDDVYYTYFKKKVVLKIGQVLAN
jgi:hypothetical protein